MYKIIIIIIKISKIFKFKVNFGFLLLGQSNYDEWVVQFKTCHQYSIRFASYDSRHPIKFVKLKSQTWLEAIFSTRSDFSWPSWLSSQVVSNFEGPIFMIKIFSNYHHHSKLKTPTNKMPWIQLTMTSSFISWNYFRIKVVINKALTEGLG